MSVKVFIVGVGSLAADQFLNYLRIVQSPVRSLYHSGMAKRMQAVR